MIVLVYHVNTQYRFELPLPGIAHLYSIHPMESILLEGLLY